MEGTAQRRGLMARGKSWAAYGSEETYRKKKSTKKSPRAGVAKNFKKWNYLTK